MEKKLQDSLDAFKNFLDNMTEEEKKEMQEYFKDDTPKGWVDIEEHLPMVTGQDLIDNDAMVKHIRVRDKDGNEFDSSVGDHHMWYYMAKEAGITHWWNGEESEEE